MGGLDTAELVVFLAGAFAAAFVTGVSGFAFGMVAAAVWLHALTPLQAMPLIVAYALLVQGYAVWRLRRAISMRRLFPFVIGSATGNPAGIALLEWAAVAHLRVGVGTVLVLFAGYNLARPELPQFRTAGTVADGMIGLLNGVVAGATGLGGILPVIWCGLRGWTRDEQRAVFQPTAVATFVMTLAWLGGAGIAGAETATLFAIGLPALLAGTALGWQCYGRIDEAGFRKVVLVLLLASGATILIGTLAA